MDQFARTPQCHAADALAFSLQACPRPRLASVRAGPCTLRDRIQTEAVPGRVCLIEGLRAKVRTIERRVERFEPSLEAPVGAPWTLPPWTLGVKMLDAALGGRDQKPGLDCLGVHEVKPAMREGPCAASARAHALGFALRLAVRRIGLYRGSAPPLIVCCWPLVLAREIGNIYGARPAPIILPQRRHPIPVGCA